MKIVNIHEAKTNLSRLLEEALAGQQIVIAKNDKPYVRLVPVARNEHRRLGFLSGYVGEEFFAQLPEEEIAAWE